MAVTGYKIYVTGNIAYIDEIVDSGSAMQFEGLAKDCLPRKKYTNSTEYSFSGFNGISEVLAIPFAQLKDGNGDAWADQATFEAWATSNLGKSSAGDSALNTTESKVRILASCPTNDFEKAHGTLRVGGSMYIGTRANGVTAPVLVHYPNKDNLSISTKIEMPLAGVGVNGIENLCYDEVNDKLYATLCNTNKILEVNPNKIEDYTIHTITLTGGIVFGLSSGCLTDGTYIYVGAENHPTGRFIKIQISDFTEVASVAWTGRSGAHAAHINLTKNLAYFTNNGTNCYLAKVSLSDLSYTEVALGLNGVTDDFAFCDGESNQTFTDFAVIGTEASVPGSLGGAVVDLDNLIVYPNSMMPTAGVFYDEIENKVYSLCVAGYIERWDFADINLNVINSGVDQRGIMDVFTMRGYMPNELLLFTDDTYTTPTELFVTIWEDYNTPQTGKLKKVTLDKVTNTSITKYEILKRFFNG